jgi:hypothetical protein
VKLASLLLFLWLTVALGVTDRPPMDPSDDFAPGLALFALFAIMVIFILIGLGVVIGAVIVASLAAVAALGIVSSSALLGLYRRRFVSGLRAFHYQICAAAALPGGVGALWLGAHLFNISLRHREIIAIGAIAGICGGLVLAFVFDRLAGLVYRRFVAPVPPDATKGG